MRLLIITSIFLFSSFHPEQGGDQSGMDKVLRVLDEDADGTLSGEEIKNAPQRLKSLDIDKSGILEEHEIGGPTPIKGQIRTQMVVRVLDRNGDLQIDQDELKLATASLLRLDENHDKQLTKKELAFRLGGANPNLPSPSQTQIQRMMSQLLAYENEVTGTILPGQHAEQYDGYTLYYESNMVQDIQLASTAYLQDSNGDIVHQWTNDRYAPEGVGAYLLENGLLLRASATGGWMEMHKYPVGAWDVLELVDWEGNVVWEYQYADDNSCMHHDMDPLPNGNILVNAYEGITKEEAASLGWEAKDNFEGLIWFESLYELKPNVEDGSTEVVWEWHSWDHVFQDLNPEGENYGTISENLNKININYEKLWTKVYSRGQLIHFNAVSYHENLDQILISSAIYGELWIIDHATTTEEASGAMGDLMYRWGRPEVVGKGTKEDNILYWQHDINWIGEDIPSQGDVIIFNNGSFRGADGSYRGTNPGMGFGQTYSDVLEIKLPIKSDGSYNREATAEIVWSYNADQKQTDFFSPFMSGARRLPNGNTLAVTAYNKRIFEVTPDGERVLDYYIPGGGQLYRVYKYPKDYPAFKGKF